MVTTEKNKSGDILLGRGRRSRRRGPCAWFRDLSLQVRDLVGSDDDELPALIASVIEDVHGFRFAWKIVEVERPVFPFGHRIKDQKRRKSRRTPAPGNGAEVTWKVGP